MWGRIRLDCVTFRVRNFALARKLHFPFDCHRERSHGQDHILLSKKIIIMAIKTCFSVSVVSCLPSSICSQITGSRSKGLWRYIAHLLKIKKCSRLILSENQNSIWIKISQFHLFHLSQKHVFLITNQDRNEDKNFTFLTPLFWNGRCKKYSFD